MSNINDEQYYFVVFAVKTGCDSITVEGIFSLELDAENKKRELESSNCIKGADVSKLRLETIIDTLIEERKRLSDGL